MLGEPTAQLVAALTAAGIRATADPRNVQPPAALVTPRQLTQRSACLFELELDVVLVAPGVPNADALDKLDELLTAAGDALPRIDGELISFTSPITGEPLAAWRLTVPVSITKGSESA